MKKEYYNEIATALTNIDGIQFGGRWKNQVSQNTPKTVPVTFIEFAPITYDMDTNLLQSATNVQFTVHLIVSKFDSNKNDDVVFDYTQKIYKALQAKDGINRLVEAFDISYDSLEDFQLTYEITRLEDHEAQKDYSEIDRPTPNTIYESS